MDSHIFFSNQNLEIIESVTRSNGFQIDDEDALMNLMVNVFQEIHPTLSKLDNPIEETRRMNQIVMNRILADLKEDSGTVREGEEVINRFNHLMEERKVVQEAMQYRNDIAPPSITQNVPSQVHPSGKPMREIVESSSPMVLSEDQRAYQAKGAQSMLQEPDLIKETRKELQKRQLIKKHTIMIDSRDRNRTIHPNPNEYKYQFNVPYRNIVAIKVIQTSIPRSEYNVNSTNNLIYFYDSASSSGEPTQATIAEGQYTTSTISAAVKTAMDAAGLASYTVAIDSTTQRMTITSDLSGGASGFIIDFLAGTIPHPSGGGSETSIYRDNSAGPWLGYAPVVTSSLAGQEASYPINLYGESYVMLKIKDIPHTEAIMGQGLQGAFAQLPLNGEQWECSYFRENSNYTAFRTFDPPLARLTHFDFRFEKYDGTLYDFNGHEHTMLWEIHAMETTEG